MNVDTGEFRALTEQMGALSRKVSALTGRVTVMGNHLHDLTADRAEKAESTVRLLARTLAWALGEDPGEDPGQPKAPEGRPRLHVIRGGQP